MGHSPTLCVGTLRFHLVGRKFPTCQARTSRLNVAVLTAARFVVEPGGHEEALLGRRRRQGPLVGRKDGNHQRRELALDLLMREAEDGGGGFGTKGWREKIKQFLKRSR